MSPSDRSAPGVRITSLTDERAASGAPLNLDGRVLAFAYEDSALKADQASLQLDNFDLSLFDRPELAGWDDISEKTLALGNQSTRARHWDAAPSSARQQCPVCGDRLVVGMDHPCLR